MENARDTSPEAAQAQASPAPADKSGAGTPSAMRVQLRHAGGLAAQQAMLSPVQGKGDIGGTDQVHDTAAAGVAGSGSSLPHLHAIQNSFGRHDVSQVQAYSGGAAAQATHALGANAYATGSKVALGNGGSDLHTVAHEAAHVVQQRAGVQLSGGVGQRGDRYEQHADQVADCVVQGKSAEGLLDGMSGGGASGVQRSVQLDAVQLDETYDFTGDDEDVITSDVYDLGTRRPYDVIQDHITGVTTALQQMKDGQLEAINNFLTSMAFSNSDEAQPDVLGSLFTYVGEQLWSTAIGKLPSVAGIPASQIFGALSAMTAELERAAAATASYNLSTFMSTMRRTAYDTMTAQITTVSGQNRALDQQFVAAEGVWTDGNPRVIGDKATFLRELDEARTAVLNEVPPQIAYEDALIVRWVTSRDAGGAGITERGSVFTEYHSNGRIEIKFDVDENDGEYSYDFENCKLYVTTKSGNAADMLTTVMRQRNKKVYELGVPVLVLLYTENLVGGQGYAGFGIRNRNDYDRTSAAGSRHANAAWRNMPWGPIDAINNIDGG